MKKSLLRAAIVLLFLPFFIDLGLAQKSRKHHQVLLKQYEEAQSFYDKATKLSAAKEYGPAEETKEKDWNDKALKRFTALARELPSAFYDSLRFYTLFKVGELQHYFENFTEAILYYKEAITTQPKSSLPDSVLFKPYLYAGIIFYNQNKFDTAIRFFKEAEKIQTSYDNKLAEGQRLYNILGVLYYERGNYRQAQNYFQKALARLDPSNAYYDELFVNYKINIAQLNLRLEEYDKANAIYQELLPKKINLNEIYHNIGSLNLSLGAAAKAIPYFRKVHYQNNKVVRLYNSMGLAFFNLSQFDSATHYYQKAIAAYHALGNNTDHVGYGLVLKNLGDHKLHFKKHREALYDFQKAIHEFYPAFSKKDIHANPEHFSGVFSYIHLFNALNAKAEAWHAIYVTENDIKAAEQELNAYQSAFKLIQYVERTYDSDEARLFLTKIKHAVHSKPIDIAFELYVKTNDKKFLTALYLFDQQNKAAVLSLNRQLNSTSAGQWSPLLQKEQAIKTEITRLSIRASQVTDTLQLANISNKIRDHEIELGKLQENRYANASAKEDNIPSIEALQGSLLDEKTTLLSYHLSSDKLTTLFITKKTVACFQQDLPKDFIEKTEQEILTMKSPATKIDHSKTFNFYDLFLFKVPLSGMEQLIIIPDDLLHYFPFETLQNSAGRYLIQDVAVQYQFSTALLAKNTYDFPGARTISFAPFANRSYHDSFPQLPHSAKEMSGANGDHLFDTAATKRNFLQQSSAYGILHLATHAVANNSAENLSYIIFSPTGARNDDLLYAQEIYNLRLHKTGLVILSACETGAGNLVKGEGVLSLSRAFSYAGCANIITSLWKADDFSTAYLTTRIHQYLAQAYSITKAIQQAKIDYLNDRSINPRFKQPYYWAHLVFVGNYAADEGFDWTWVIVSGAFALLLVVLLVKRPAQKRHSMS